MNNTSSKLEKVLIRRLDCGVLALRSNRMKPNKLVALLLNPTLYLTGMLDEVVNRPNLDQKRPLCSKDQVYIKQ